MLKRLEDITFSVWPLQFLLHTVTCRLAKSIIISLTCTKYSFNYVQCSWQSNSYSVQINKLKL